MKVRNVQINAERTEQKQHRYNMMKPQANTFLKYCNYNTKKVLHKAYTYYAKSMDILVKLFIFHPYSHLSDKLTQTEK
jgi:hypothetical protein